MRRIKAIDPIKVLEKQIFESYDLINGFEAIRQDSSDPKEKLRCKREINEQWELIEEYLDKYLALCNTLNHKIHRNIHQISVHFPKLLASDFISAYTILKAEVPEHADAVDNVLRIITEFGKYHEQLKELKDLHNYSQELITSLIPLKSEIESILDAPNKYTKASTLRMWSACRSQILKMESFAKDIKHIDTPYIQYPEKNEGPIWLLSILALKNELEINITEADITNLYSSIMELWDVTFDCLYLADKKLRDNVSELYGLSSMLLRSIS